MITSDLAERVTSRRLRVVVIGDAILDGWLTGSSERLCPEAPVPVVDVSSASHVPGGAANTAVNLAALGASVRLVSAVGDDPAGAQLVGLLDDSGVGTGQVLRVPGRPTVTKRRVVVRDQLMLRVDEGRSGPLDGGAAGRLAGMAREALDDADAVVLCDYGTGVLGPQLGELLCGLRDRMPLLAVDAHRFQAWRALRPDLVTPNAAEAAALLGIALPPHDRIATMERHRADLHAATGARAVVVTFDRDGSVLFVDGQPAHRTWATPAPDNHAAGAGDTFVSALTLAAGAGLPLTTAVELAQAAADVVTGRPGTAACTADELARRLGAQHGGVVDRARLAALVAEHRAAGRRIVFTNGCFDVLHRGHLAYLRQARQLGDVLVVGINSDASVRRLKGESRPVNSESDRAAVIAALSCVDHVTVFEEDTPVELVRLLRPELYVKGGDYTPQMLPETPVVESYGGRVQVVDYVPDHSTTATIERIRRSAATTTSADAAGAAGTTTGSTGSTR
jgi:rfaE bifunctional protein kinase chain/domain/rfaE bifunctional protein nucleotidyltransferase chain/domain